MSVDISYHDIEKIFVATNTEGTHHWFHLVLEDKDGNKQEITIFGTGRGTMPEVVFGEPD